MNEREIFVAALHRSDPDERATYLAQACGDDPALRQRVEALLHEHDRLGSFLESPAAAPGQLATVDDPLSERPGAVIGPYKLLEQIGEGGFGVVFLAEQSQPVRRNVALKVLKPGMDTRHVIARFEAERQALALMDHPNIAKVFDGGATASGRPYFVMELVKGVPITEFCDQNHLTPKQRLELFVPVCQAVQHAHQKGIIHRDLKPSNVLVTMHDTTPVVKVIDFGVAKALGQELTDKTLFTGLAQMVGTPLYMSPEQAGQSSLDIDTRSDIYALGVLLYELLTGTTPFTRERFKQAGYDEIRRIIREEDPPRPSTRLSESRETLPSISAQRQTEPAKLTRLLKGELDWIVMKALEKDRNRRYDTANGFAHDLQRYLHDEPVQACPPSVLYRARKFSRRHRVALAMAAVVAAALVVLAGALGVSTLLVWRANRELQQALARERDVTYFQRIALAERELAAIRGSRAEQLLDQCPPGQRGWEWYLLKRRLHEEPLAPEGHTMGVGGVAFSPNGRVLASGSWDGSVRLWDPHSGACLRVLTGESQTYPRVAFSPDGQSLAAASWDGAVTVWDLAADQRRLLKGHTDRVDGVAFSPDGRHLASAGADGAVILWDLSGADKRVFSGHGGAVRSVAYSPDGQRLASAGDDAHVHVWDVRTGEVLLELKGHQNGVSQVAFSPDGRHLASASMDQTVRLWDAATGREVWVLHGHTADVAGVAFSPDGRRLVSAGDDMTVRVWDPVTGQEALTLHDHQRGVLGVAFSPDGWRLAAAGAAKGDIAVRIWNATPSAEGDGPEPLRVFTGHTREVNCVTFTPDGKLLASGSDDKTVRVWDAATGQLIHALQGPGIVNALAFSSDGTRLAAAGDQGVVKIWDARTGQDVLTRRLSSYGLSSMAYSPDGRLALADHEGYTRVLDAATGKELAARNGQVASLLAVAFSPDGQWLASGSADKAVRIWDTRTQRVHVLRGHEAAVNAVAYGPDGRSLATAGNDGLVFLWDMTAAAEVRRLRAHRDAVNSVQISPDGRWLATASQDATVKVWDAATGRLLGLIRPRQHEVFGVAFHPGGRQLASAGGDGTVRTWAVPTAAPRPNQ